MLKAPLRIKSATKGPSKRKKKIKKSKCRQTFTLN